MVQLVGGKKNEFQNGGSKEKVKKEIDAMLAQDPASDYPDLPPVILETWRKLKPMTTDELEQRGEPINYERGLDIG